MKLRFKKDKWTEFTEHYVKYGFYMDTIKYKRVYVRIVNIQQNTNNMELDSIFLIITMDGFVHLVTPSGESPFMESHESAFKDLLNAGFVEYVKGEFD